MKRKHKKFTRNHQQASVAKIIPPSELPKPLGIKYLILSYALIIALGTLIYSNSFRCGFHLDDFQNIVQNSSIQNVSDLGAVWNYWPCRFLTYISFAVNDWINGSDVGGYHVFNLAVHLLSSIMVWWLVLLTLRTPVMKDNAISRHAVPIALLAALVFVTHPLQTEAVTYIVQRASSMTALFYLLSLCLYIKFRLGQEGPLALRLYYACSLLAAVAAMFTKEMAVSLPLVVLLYEASFFKPLAGLNWKCLLPFLLSIAVIPLTMAWTHSVDFQVLHRVRESAPGISPIHYLLTQFRVMVTYVQLLFLPVHQNMDYDYPVFTSFSQGPVIMSFLFLLTILGLALRLFSNYRLIAFSIFWFFLTLMPESSILPIKDVIFEHRLYLPMVGYSIFLAGGAYYLWGKNLKVMIIVLGLIIAFYSFLTYERNKVWRDEVTLWKDVIAKSPQKARAYNDLGEYYRNQNNLDEALFYYTKVIDLDQANSKTYLNRGSIYANEGRDDLAILDYDKAIALDGNFALAYENRGNNYAKEGRWPQVISDLSKAVELGVQDANVDDDLGIAYGKQGDFTQAIEEFSKAIALKSNFALAYNNRGYAYFRKGIYDKAILDYNKAIDLKPDFPQAYSNRISAEQAEALSKP